MTLEDFKYELSKLKDDPIVIVGQNINEEFRSILIKFLSGSTLKANYWRLIKAGKHFLSSFDQGQKYGLPSHTNAFEIIKNELDGKCISEAVFEKETGDIIFKFNDDLKLQILNLTGYEVWEFNFASGKAEYSNHAREYPSK